MLQANTTENPYRKKNSSESPVVSSNGNNYPSKRSKVDLQYQADNDNNNNNASNGNNNNASNGNNNNMPYARKQEDKKITDVFQENYKALVDQHKKSPSPMDGDLPALALRSMYVMGVKVGWPYPEMLPPQRQMGTHIIRGLKSSKHVVLESPTGTGKSAAILCSALAWQRYHQCTSHETVQIIYCSRTHSQVAQMVTSLLATPYRPSMTVLGSRDRMCIHETITNRDSTKSRNKGSGRQQIRKNVNVECRNRIKATDAYRKRELSIKDKPSRDLYNDNDPIPFLPSDEYEQVTVDTESNREVKPTCQHYRQLSTLRTASSVYNAFRPSQAPPIQQNQQQKLDNKGGIRTNALKSNCNASTKDGTHDIEDLVQFGKNPYKRIVTLKRTDITSQPWGLKIEFSRKSGETYPKIQSFVPGGIGSKCNELRVHDQILAINGVSMAYKSVQDVGAFMTSKTIMTMSVTGSSATMQTQHTETYSAHSACPYYISRRLAPDAELVFCPYNYILDPAIRSAMNLGIENKVVVLDEAHNVESTLRESGSGVWSEFVFAEIMEGLVYESHANRQFNGNPQQAPTIPVAQMAHELIEFLEPILLYLFDAKAMFETNGGAKKAIQDWEKFHTSDNETFEMSYDGPNGHGVKGKMMGCNAFFEHKVKIKLEHGQAEQLRLHAEKLLETNQMGGHIVDQLRAVVFETLVEVVGKLTHAFEEPQHYFIQTNAQPNGSFEYAAGIDTADRSSNRRNRRQQQQQQQQQQRRNPKALPIGLKRTVRSPNEVRDVCKFCKDKKCSAGHKLVYGQGLMRHGSYNNGSKPSWESTLVLDLLTPSLNMEELAKNCRSVILASGSLAPLPSLCAELGLYPAEEETSSAIKPKKEPVPAKSETVPETPNAKASVAKGVKTELKVENVKARVDTTLNTKDLVAAVRDNLKVGEEGTGNSGDIDDDKKSSRRLQVKPPPLEANHVIDLDRQLFAVAIGQFPNGDSLTVRYSEYKHDAFVEKLGDAVASVIESIPRGGVLVFLPSYSFLGRCKKSWNPAEFNRYNSYNNNASAGGDVWDRLIRSKGKVIVEPTGTQADFEEARDEYAETIRTTGNCILFAVFRGKMSEGISFNDDNARGVICVGIPYPSSFSRSIKAKQSYNDEQRKLEKRNDMLMGKDWYSQQAYRAVAQALGRCIRHVGDYGTVVLLDSRFADESPPDGDGVCSRHRTLPKWMRGCVRSLTRKTVHGTGHDDKLVGGGWDGLKQELHDFFLQAPAFTADVLQKQSSKLAEAQHRARSTDTSFNSATGNWSLSQPSPTAVVSDSSPNRTQTPSTASSARSADATPVTKIESNFPY